jgi:DNA-binding XRE family transcriptional regulator
LLKARREGSGLTQGAAAAFVGVQRATFTQWESARHLPSMERVHELDRLFHADGGLIAAAERARGEPRLQAVASEIAPDTARSLLQVFKDTRRAFLAQLCEDRRGRPGWRHNLVPSDEPVSTLSTAYGLGVLAMLGGPDASTPAVVDNVLERAYRDDEGRLVGWKARTQYGPRLEATSMAIDGLLRVGVPIATDDVLRMVRNLLDDTARERPFVLTMALRPVLRIAPDSTLARQLIDALLDARIEIDGVRLWPEKRLDRQQLLLDPLVVHTARAVTVLRDAPGELVGDAVVAAEQWLAGMENLGGVSEVIRRREGPEGREEFSVDHFTSAWVARALAGGANPDRRRITHVLKVVWERYDPQHHFWAWGNGDVPVWMLSDAVAALQETAFALRFAPGPPTPNSN